MFPSYLPHFLSVSLHQSCVRSGQFLTIDRTHFCDPAMPLRPPASARVLPGSPMTARPPRLTSQPHQTPIGPNSPYRCSQGCHRTIQYCCSMGISFLPVCLIDTGRWITTVEEPTESHARSVLTCPAQQPIKSAAVGPRSKTGKPRCGRHLDTSLIRRNDPKIIHEQAWCLESGDLGSALCTNCSLVHRDRRMSSQ